nr:DNA-directed DNA polymerase [Tanacetum cinerariifolium]
MRTRSKSYPFNSNATIPIRSNRRRVPNIVEPEIRTIKEIVSMAERTMEELLQAPTEGYGEAIVISKILAENFEIKTNLLQLFQANKFHGFESDNPHTHISNFKRMTVTLKYRDVPNNAIKLMLFLYSLEGAARIWRVPNIIEPEIRTIKEIVLMADRTMEELLQAPTEGYGEATVIPEILAENFEIKTNLFQDVPNDAIKLMLFSYSLEGAARIWYEKEPPNLIITWDDLVNKFDHFKEMLRACPHHGFSELTQIDTFYNGLTEQDQDSLNAAAGGNLLNKTTREALKIIKNKSKVRYSRSKLNVSRVNTNSRDSVSKNDDRIDKLADHISNLVEIVNKQVITLASAKAVEKTYVTCGGAHAYYDCIATDSNQPSVCTATGSYNQEENLRRNLNNDMRSILGSFFQNQASTSGTLSSNIMPNPKGEMKAVTTRSGLAYEGPSIPTNSPLEKVVEQNTEETTDKEHSNCPGSTAHVQPLVVPISIPEPDVLRTQTKPTIPYPSRLNNQKLREKATNQMEKFFQIFHDLHFDISFTDALLLMPKFASIIKSLLTNKDKLFELAKVPLNENCSAMLLKKLPEKLGDPGKFLIPCDFPRMDVCHALADLGASINLMPLSIWKKLSLPELTLTRMTLELANRSITHPKGVVKDVFIKVGKFHFPTDFVVVDFKADLRVPLILRRSFLRTDHALIDIYGEELPSGICSRCFDFQYNPKSSNPTLVSDPSIPESDSYKEPIVKFSSPTLTPFGESDFFLEEIKDFLNDDSIPMGIKNFVYNLEGDILFLEKLLNEDPFQLPPMYLKLAEESKAKSSFEEPPELELKELPSHLEYVFLENYNKLPVIIAKNLKDVEKEALINVLKSHKWAIAWKIFDIKGIDPRFYTHMILMEDDYKPAVQSQRRVNPKIHDVIKKEVIKLLDAGMIYLISDSPWVSPIHCVPKKGGMTVVANENNELIPTRLVTGWRVCIDYRKLNDATRKDHFPLPFMDQVLERLVGNEFYCFLDGFSGYFQIPIDPQDQEKLLSHALTEPSPTKTMEVFMDDFLVFGDSFSSCLTNLDKMLKRCEETNLVLNWEKCHFMCREGIVLGHKILKSGIEVNRAKVDVIAKLPHPTNVKGVRSFLGHAGFYRCFIQDFSKITRPMTHLLEKEIPFVFSKECVDAFNTLKKKLTEAPILVVPDWNLPFELMCDASDFAIGVVLGQRKTKHFQPIQYARKTMTGAQIHYTMTEKEMLSILLISLKLDMRDLLGAIMVPILQQRREIISDRGTYFCNDQFTRVMIKYGVTHHLATAYRPEMSGQVKVSNHGLKRILERTVGENLASRSDKLDDALWAFRTAFKTPIGCTPYKLTACDHRKLQLNELSELRDQAYENFVIYKERTKKLHDSKIKNHIFNVGDQVLLFNSRLKIFSRKLKTRWSGPFTIT